MSNTANIAVGLFQIIGTLFGILFIVIQLLIRQGPEEIDPGVILEVIKTILLAMFLLVVAAIGITWVFVQEISPDLVIPVGLITLVLSLIFFSTLSVMRALMKNKLFTD